MQPRESPRVPYLPAAPISPKQRIRDSIYPFYAGFSHEFAVETIRRFEGARVVLDPWNGAGTTTTAAAALGKRAIGIDINPAMIVVAKARLCGERDLKSAARFVSEDLRVSSKSSLNADALELWFGPQTATVLRNLAIQIAGARTPTAARLQTLPYYRAFLLTALFNTAKRLVAPLASSNPTWTRTAKGGGEKLHSSPRELKANFLREVERLDYALRQQLARRRVSADFGIHDSRALPLEDSSVDLVVTSPPYCTRLDYPVTTAVELAITNRSGVVWRKLRVQSLGTTAIPSKVPMQDGAWGSACVKLLDAVRSHKSKASASYYYKTHVAYFAGLYQSIREIARVLAPGGNAVIVVQDSYYKELHNDVPAILTEMSNSAELQITNEERFPVRASMATVNRGARAYRASHPATEVVLTLTRQAKG